MRGDIPPLHSACWCHGDLGTKTNLLTNLLLCTPPIPNLLKIRCVSSEEYRKDRKVNSKRTCTTGLQLSFFPSNSYKYKQDLAFRDLQAQRILKNIEFQSENFHGDATQGYGVW